MPSLCLCASVVRLAVITRRVLVLAEGFPPLGGSGVQRTTKFVKYLPESGWRCAVLTGDPERDRPGELDRSLLAEIPADTLVRRLPFWNPAAALFRRLAPRRSGGPATFNSLATPTEASIPDGAGALRRAFRTVRSFLVAPVADGLWYWNRRARGAALAFCREVGASVIYVSGSPFSSMLLGLWLKRRTGLPLVVDFRDPWTLFHPELAHGLRFRLNRHFERQVLVGADAVICNHEPMRADFERIEPRCRGRCTVITNGFDPADFAGPAPAVEPGVLAHVGLAWEDSPHPVLRALGALRSRGGLPPAFRLRFLGGLPPSSLDLVGRLGLGDAVAVEARTSHSEATAAMRSAGCLLLLLVGSQAGGKWYPGKLFEYLAAGRPTLCISPPGIAADLVRESGCGVTLGPGDSAGIEKTLAEIAADPVAFAARVFRPRPEVIARFDRRKQAAQLAAILDRVAAGRGPEAGG